MTQDESRGKAYVKDDGKLGLRCIDLGWTVSGDTGPDVQNCNSYRLRASAIDTALSQDSDWTQSNSDQGIGHQ